MDSDHEDIEHKPLEDCLYILRAYRNAAEIKAINNFKKTLSIIAVHHAKNGLNDEQLELLTSFIFSENLKIGTINLLIQCMVPKHVVSEKIITKIVLYVLSSYQNIRPAITVLLLKWLIGILEYELCEITAVDDFYRLFFYMLGHENLEIHKYVTRILFMLTKPEDVTEEKVMLISQCEFKYGKKKYTQALLSLFKCYQPECVPESVPVMKVFDIPQYLPSKIMETALLNSHKRNIEGSNNAVSFKNRTPHIKLFEAGKMKPNYSKSILPQPVYKNDTDNKRRATDIKNIIEIEECMYNVQLPSNVLSLLGSESGLHLLTFGDESLQFRFLFKLNDTFNKELNEKVLKPLFDIFLTSDVEMICDIISSLSGLLTNMFQVDLFRFDHGIKPLFLGGPAGWISEDISKSLGSTIKAIKHFITFALLMKPNSLQVLHKAISFYELLFCLETRSNRAVMTVVPYNIVYHSFFSLTTTAFSRVCKLILAYPEVIYKLVADDGLKTFEKDLKLIDAYCYDIMNCLWYNEAFSNRGAGVIFISFNISKMKKLNEIIKCDTGFSVTQHIMFLHFISHLLQTDLNLSLTDIITPEKILHVMDLYAPDIAIFIKQKLNQEKATI
ncbi:centromere protein I-like isoform X2 [Lycorma delicatula]|uniref:centromere protein I-like isoform X2 n=1 Tax=Lycorma delicatula TaxID=130591 RepID=UPI003F5168D8